MICGVSVYFFNGNEEMNLKKQLMGPTQKAEETDKRIRTFLCHEVAEAYSLARTPAAPSLLSPPTNLSFIFQNRGFLGLTDGETEAKEREPLIQGHLSCGLLWSILQSPNVP